MTHYNPFIEASKAAIATLTNDEAKAYYASRALEDIDRVITVCTAIYSVAHFVYSVGAMASELVNVTVEASTAKASKPVQKCLPTPKAIALLAPAKSDNTKAPVTGLIESLTDTDDFRHETHLKLTKAQLIDRCAARGLQPKKSMRKAELAAMLTQSYSTVKPWQYRSRSGRVVSVA